MNSMASGFIDELPDKYIKENKICNDEDNDFEFIKI